MSGWIVERRKGPAGELHGLPLKDPARRLVRVYEVSASAIVLGSAQPEDTIVNSDGFEVVRRNSGGGAVILVPGGQLWVDVTLPRDDPRWDDDVGRAPLWLGRAWSAALAELGVVSQVHVGASITSRWHRMACFAGVGAGEVLVEGAKLIGISQRRTRSGARFQCALPLDGRYRSVADHLRLSSADRRELAHHLAATTSSVDELDALASRATPAADVLAALLMALGE